MKSTLLPSGVIILFGPTLVGGIVAPPGATSPSGRIPTSLIAPLCHSLTLPPKGQRVAFDLRDGREEEDVGVVLRGDADFVAAEQAAIFVG